MSEDGREQGGLGLTRPPPIRGLQLPKQFEMEGNTAENWKLFKKKWSNYAVLSHLDLQYKVAMFLNCLGDESLKVYDGFEFATPEEDRKLEEIVQSFETFAVGNVNIMYERAVFNKRDQQEGEPFYTYLAALRSLIKTCNYCDKCRDTLLKDRIVVGIRNEKTHMELVKDRKDFTELVKDRKKDLSRCIDVCRTADKTQKVGKVLRPETINAVWQKNTTISKETGMGSKGALSYRNCKFCGTKHEFRMQLCPAWQQKCQKCGKSNLLRRCAWLLKKRGNSITIRREKFRKGCSNSRRRRHRGFGRGKLG